MAKPAASSPSGNGPGVQRPRAHPTALGGRPCRGARQCGLAASGCTWSNVPPCDSGRGHCQGGARTRRRGEGGRDNPHGRSRPPATRSTGTSATPRSCGPAGACSLPPQVRAREGRPRSPLREKLGPSGSSSLGVSPPLPPDATGFGNAPATSRDCPEASSSSADMRKAAREDRRIARTHPRPPLFLVADGGLQSNRVGPGGEDKNLFQPREGDNS